jgi:Uma2 family endonuclease
MSAVLKPPSFISVEEYLEGELVSEIKHEYEDGEVYVMAGATLNHERIAGNVFGELRQYLKELPCEAVSKDFKVNIKFSKFYYPDVMVMCDERKGDDVYTETPILIVEVLSKSTHRRDKSVKRAAYQSLPSLQEYVLIEQDIAEVIVFRRDENWFPQSYFLGETVHFKSVDFHLPVEEIYRRVDNEDMQAFLQAGESEKVENN